MTVRPTVVFLALQPMQAAGTRLRAHQTAQRLAHHGIDATVRTFVPTWLGARWMSGSLGLKLAISVISLLRLPWILLSLRSAHVVVVRKEVLPVGSARLELCLIPRSMPLVWDIDDAEWLARRLGGMRGKPSKYLGLARRADVVWTGSDVLREMLEDEVGRLKCRVVRTLPPTIDVAPKGEADILRAVEGRYTIGWIGSPSTTKYLLPILGRLLAESGELPGTPTFLVVGASAEVLPASPMVRVVPWSIDAEQRFFETTDIGLYPLDTSSPYATAKAGLKSIQYYFSGIPVIASESPNLRELDPDGRATAFVRDEMEWGPAIAGMLSSVSTWREWLLGANEVALKLQPETLKESIVASELRALIARRQLP